MKISNTILTVSHLLNNVPAKTAQNFMANLDYLFTSVIRALICLPCFNATLPNPIIQNRKIRRKVSLVATFLILEICAYVFESIHRSLLKIKQ